jgi:hypothetical protein
MLFTNFALLLLPTAALAFSDTSLHEQSRSRARLHYARQHGAKNVTENGVEVEKRGQTFGGRATFYDVGLGACGWYKWVHLHL